MTTAGNPAAWEAASKKEAAVLRPPLSRGQITAGIAVAIFCNAIVRTCLDYVYVKGAWMAVMATFGISAVVWASLAIGASMASKDDSLPGKRDVIVYAACSAACFVPVDAACWLALTAISIYAIWTSTPGTDLRRGGWILLGSAVPLFWSKMVFFFLIDYILAGDALLAAAMLGTERVGNTVRFADGSGFLWIAPACSSFANVSLAVVCWMTFLRVRGLEVTAARLSWCVAACFGVVAVNVVRIALIGFLPSWYGFLHEGEGAVLAGWATIAVIVGLCHYGLRTAPPRSA